MTYSIRHYAFLGLPLALLVGCGDLSTLERAGPAEAETAAPVVTIPETTPPPMETFTVTVLLDADALPAHAEIPLTEDDLLQRIRAGFQLPDPDERAVQAEVNWYARHPEYLDRVFGRSTRYMHWIVEEIEKRDMPLELALLPVVESAFDPFAYSHGRAAGLWQFIPGTGRRFGLKQNWWYDGRRDVVDSTRGALDYLQYLHNEFNGDWLLAVAAYNSGEGNVHKAVRRNRKKGKPTDFWHLRLPKETRAYVPKLLAMRRIVERPDRFGLAFDPIPNEPYFAVVDTTSQIDLALAADLAGLDVDTVYSLNPGFNRWATDPDGPHRLLVPLDYRQSLEAGLETLSDRDRVRWTRHRIRNGETLSTIANRYGTTTTVLKQVNGVRGSTIRAGSHLMVPTATRSLDTYTLSAESRLKKIQSNGRGRTKTTYKVKPGDSLWDIARSQGVNTRSLAKWNGMAPGDVLSVGRELVVWNSRATTATGPSNTTRRVNYTVRKGDSLSRIASRFRVSVSQLKRWNKKLSGQRYLQPGQKLVMYVDVTRQSG